MMNTLLISGGVKAALLAVGVTASAPAPAPATATHTQVHVAPQTQRAILAQIDHRLGVIERAQRAMLRGYETGGIYR